MSNGDKGEQGRADAERSQVGMMRLFGQMLLFPFTVFVFGIELFARTIRDLQRTADEGMNLLAGDVGPPSEHVSVSEGQSTDSVISRLAEVEKVAEGNWAELKSQTIAVTGDASVRDAGKVTDKETVMRDKDLNDDQLKLVRYKILFVKRDYETAFLEKEELVPDNMTGDAFAAWKVAEFIQRLGDKETYIPSDWTKGDKLKYPEEAKYVGEKDGRRVLLGLPEKDKKYLRVFYEVLERYVREEDEDDQVDMLREIRNTLRGGITVFTREAEDDSTGSSAGGGPTGGGGGPVTGGGAVGTGGPADGGAVGGSAGGGRGYES